MTPPTPSRRAAALAGLPADVRTAAERYFAAPTSAGLDELTDSILRFFAPTDVDNPSPPTPYSDSLRLLADLKLDSMATVELHFILTDVLGARFNDDQLRSLRTVGDLRVAVRELVAHAKP